jgi:hypothetical protein
VVAEMRLLVGIAGVAVLVADRQPGSSAANC